MLLGCCAKLILSSNRRYSSHSGQVAMVFGPHILQYSINLCQGQYDYLVRLPNSILFNIMAYFNLEDISGLSHTCRRFREVRTTLTTTAFFLTANLLFDKLDYI